MSGKNKVLFSMMSFVLILSMLALPFVFAETLFPWPENTYIHSSAPIFKPGVPGIIVENIWPQTPSGITPSSTPYIPKVFGPITSLGASGGTPYIPKVFGPITSAPQTSSKPTPYIPKVFGPIVSSSIVQAAVSPNIRPVANAGPDRIVYVDDFVVLDGSLSRDYDGQIASYEWREEEILLSNSISFSRVYSEGSHAVSLKVTDNSGGTDIDSVIITVLPKRASIDVFNVDVSPSTVDGSDHITISASIKLLEISSGEHSVSVKMYIDGDEKDSETLFLKKDQVRSVSFEFATRGLSEGMHKAKIVATVDSVSDQETDSFEVEKQIEFVSIDDFQVSPSSICADENEAFDISARVELKNEEKDRVRAMFLIEDDDNNFFFIGDDEKVLEKGDEKTFSTTYDYEAFDLSPGTHEAKIIVENNGRETEFTKFELKDCGGIRKDRVDVLGVKPEHCLKVEDVWTFDKLKPGKSADINVRISNCGRDTESGVNTNLEVFGKTHSITPFSLGSDKKKDVIFTIDVPRNADGITKMKSSVANRFTEDSLSREFNILNGVPFINVKKEQVVNICETNKVEFSVVNKGEIEDIFALKVTGEAGEWFSAVPNYAELKPKETKKVEAFVDVPCDAKEGTYQFTLTASGSPDYLVTSSLKAVKVFSLPDWFGLSLLSLFFLILIVSATLFYKPKRKRKTPEIYHPRLVAC